VALSLLPVAGGPHPRAPNARRIARLPERFSRRGVPCLIGARPGHSPRTGRGRLASPRNGLSQSSDGSWRNGGGWADDRGHTDEDWLLTSTATARRTRPVVRYRRRSGHSGPSTATLP